MLFSMCCLFPEARLNVEHQIFLPISSKNVSRFFLQCLLGGVERRANLLSTELSVETELLVRQLSFTTRQVSMVESIRSFSHLCNASESNTARLTILMCPATILTFRTSDISYHQKLQPRLRGNYFFGSKVLCKAEVWLIDARLMLASLRSGDYRTSSNLTSLTITFYKRMEWR